MVNFIVGRELTPADRKQNFKVIIIGAGMSGLLAAIRLQEAGIPFEIIERHADVGGTWYQNTYPGCRVDSPNHIYSYSFRPADWPQYYSPQQVLREYFDKVAVDYGLKRHTRFGTEVTHARFDDDSGAWEVSVKGADGHEQVLHANAVISAVGQLNRPKWPDIPGQEKFRGIAFHSTEWEHEHDLTGKNILVIGTGASAFQFAPEIAKVASQVTIFQRTPPWMAPVPTYHDDVPAAKHWLLNHVPYYSKWYRFAMFWNAAEGILFAVKKDPAWNGENSISAENDELRQIFTDWITEQCEGDADLLEKAIPRYLVGGKRILFDNGNWLRALRPLPLADEGHRPRRHRPAAALERRSARVPGHHRARVPQSVLLLRAEHQHRGARQHRVLLRMRSALHPRLHQAAAGARAGGAGLQAGRSRRLQQAHRPGQPGDGLGRSQRADLVQERPGAGHAELAVQPGGILEADAGTESAGLRTPSPVAAIP